MFRPLFLFIGLRYTRAKRRNHFISFISMTSMTGIALGVAVLITVLSVMNGFDKEIRTRIFEMAPQVTIKSLSENMQSWSNLEANLKQFPQIKAMAPFVSDQGMLTHTGMVHPVLIQGVNPPSEMKVSKLESKMTQGSLSALKANHFGIVLGQDLADSLGLFVNDKVTLVTPEATITPAGVIPRFKRFTVVGVFKAGSGFGYDSQLGYINIKDAQKLFRMGTGISGIRLKIGNLYDAPQLSSKIAQSISSNYYVTNWTEQYGPLFKAIKLEKTMMFLMLLLIVAVAAFNLVSSLVMAVNDKISDIAILRTFGVTPKTIMAIFIVQGLVVGLIGTLLGTIGGIILALHVTQVVSAIETIFHVQLISSSVYYVNYLPSQLQWLDVLHICISAFVLCFVATIYPAWRAARTQPAEALRYE